MAGTEISSAVALVHSTTQGRRWLVALAIVSRLSDESLRLAKPLLVGAIIDRLASGGANGSRSLEVCLLGLAVLAVLRAIATYVYGSSSARLGRGSASRLRWALVETWLRHGLGGLPLGDAVTRSGRDVDRLRTFVDRLYVRGPTGIVRAIGPIVLLVSMDPALAGLALAVLPVQQIVLRWFESGMQRAARLSSEASANFVGSLTEALSDNDLSNAHRGMLREQVSDIETSELVVARLQAGVRFVTVLGTGLGLSLVWIFASPRVSAGEMTVGELVSFAGCTELVYQPFRQLASVSKTYRSGLASLERVADIIRDRSQLELSRSPH